MARVQLIERDGQMFMQSGDKLTPVTGMTMPSATPLCEIDPDVPHQCNGAWYERQHRMIRNRLRIGWGHDVIDVTPHPMPQDRFRRTEAGRLHAWIAVPIPVWLARRLSRSN